MHSFRFPFPTEGISIPINLLGGGGGRGGAVTTEGILILITESGGGYLENIRYFTFHN